MSAAGGIGVTMAVAGMGYTAGTFVTSVGNNIPFLGQVYETKVTFVQVLAKHNLD